MKPIHFRRAVGNTTALLNGVRNSDCIFVCLNKSHVDIIRRENPSINRDRIASLNDNLSGFTKPIVLDHSIFQLIQSKNRMQEITIEELTTVVQEQIYEIGLLKDKIYRPKKKIWEFWK